jgi:RING-box protein 1
MSDPAAAALDAPAAPAVPDAPAGLDALPKHKVTVKKMAATAMWRIDVQNEECAICRCSLQELCILCQVAPSDACLIAVGECTHEFHMHCIDKWVKDGHGCPLDKEPWETVAFTGQ